MSNFFANPDLRMATSIFAAAVLLFFVLRPKQ